MRRLDEPDFRLWLRANPAPDLQLLISTYGNGFSGVPADAWADFDRQNIDWDVKRRTRLGQLLKNSREVREEKKKRKGPAKQLVVK